MKKLMLLAALGAAAILTACGDDSSSGAPASGCSVSSADNAVTITINEAGYTSVTTYTITETGYKITYSGDGAEGMPETDVPSAEAVTIDQLKQIADEGCKTWESAETVPAE